MNNREEQLLRTLDKRDKIGIDAVIELLQKPLCEFGADLDPIRAGLIGKFARISSKDNFDTISEILEWFDHAPKVMNRFNLMVALEKIEITPGYTLCDRLIDMPPNEDQTWLDHGRPKNIGWALDDILAVISKAKPQKTNIAL